MALETVEAARAFLLSIFDSEPRYRFGVYTAVLGGEVAKLGQKGFHLQFGARTLAEFIKQQCSDILNVRMAPNNADYLISRVGHTGRSPAPRAFRIDPKIWSAVLSNQPRDTYINPSGSIKIGDAPSTGTWTKIEQMPQARQVEVLDGIRESLKRVVSSEQVKAAILECVDTSRSAENPIWEFSRVVGSLFTLAQEWNRLRVQAVSEHVETTTGVALQPAESPAAPQSPTWGSARPRRASPTDDGLPAPISSPASAEAPDELAALRGSLKRAIDLMSHRDLLDMKLPVDVMIRSLQPKGSHQ